VLVVVGQSVGEPRDLLLRPFAWQCPKKCGQMTDISRADTQDLMRSDRGQGRSGAQQLCGCRSAGQAPVVLRA